MPKSLSNVVTINGGSSSIKFAVFTCGEPPQRLLAGEVERIGLGDTTLVATHVDTGRIERLPIDAADQHQAAEQLADWLASQAGTETIAAVGHRVVHGGTQLLEHQPITDEVLAELRRAQPLDLVHLPREIALAEVFRQKLPHAMQVACFDTAFFRDLPRVAQMLPIPRKYASAGVRRFGFHGLSYAYLISKLQSIAPSEASGRVILAHLGSGASMAALRAGQPIDTSMAFTPTAGLVMGTRSGDLDPGLLVYVMRSEKMSFDQADDFLNCRCGLIGLAETTYDMRDLLARRNTDPRAAEAVELFCYQAKKFVGAYAAALGGLDALVFSGGIGEHAAVIRAEICAGLEFLGVRIDSHRNAASSPIISAENAAVTVRVIPTDEERVIAGVATRLASGGGKS